MITKLTIEEVEEVAADDQSYVAPVIASQIAKQLLSALNREQESLEVLEYFTEFAALNDDGEDERFAAMLGLARAHIARGKEA